MLTAQGSTHTGTAIYKGANIIQSRKDQCRAKEIVYYRTWLFMITDVEPQGEAGKRIEEVNKRVSFIVGVENENMTRLSQISVRTPIKLKGISFTELFPWLSASMSAVFHSRLDKHVVLLPYRMESVLVT